MREFDVIVVGGGTGNNTAAAAADRGLDTALIDKGPLGGTCLNRGCNPSKMQIHRARVADGVREAGKFGVDASIDAIDFAGGVRETTETLADIAESMEEGYRERENLTLYKDRAEFVDERTLEVGGETIRGEKVVVAAGTRPVAPPIDGLDEVDYLDSTDALRLTEQPDELVILGGGYIAAELGYFYSAMGTAVTMIEMLPRLLPREDPDVGEEFTEIARRRHDVYTGYRATGARQENGRVSVTAESEDGEEIRAEGDELLVAVGRRANTDTLNVEAAGIETDENGFVETDEYLASTSAENVWAQGDIAGNWLFKHTGDYETGIVVANALDGAGEPVDYDGVGHAVFTEPQVGAVGATEDELEEAGRDYVVAKKPVPSTPMARAMKLEDGFVKVLADPDGGEILGCHILGHEASSLVHSVVVALRSGTGTVYDLSEVIHVHPALDKVVVDTFKQAAEKVDGA